MLNRFTASLGLVFAAFAATTGVSAAAIDSETEVMYLTAAVVVVFLVIVTTIAAGKHALGLDKMAPADPNEHFGHHPVHGADDNHEAEAAAGAHDDHGEPAASAAQTAHH